MTTQDFKGTLDNTDVGDLRLSYFYVSIYDTDTTAAIAITFTPTAGPPTPTILEIRAAIGDTGATDRYGCILRYAVVNQTAGDNALVTDMTHDLVSGVTEAVAATNNVVTVTITCSTNIDIFSAMIMGVGRPEYPISSVTVS